MSARTAALVVLPLLLVLTPQARAFDAHAYVAVADTVLGKGIDPVVGELVANSVVEGAQQARTLQVIDRSRQASVVSELQAQCSDMTAPECRVEMGQQLGAGYLLVPELRRVGKMYFLTVSWLDLATGLAKETRNRSCKCEADGVMELAKALTLEVLGASAAAPAPARPTTTTASPGVGTGTLLVETRPPGANIVVDGVPRGATAAGKPVRVAGLSAGQHQITIPEASAHRAASQDALVAPGIEASILIELDMKPGELMVYSAPVPGKVIANGRALGQTPGPFSLSAGRYEISVEAAGYEAQPQSIEVRAGQRAQLSVPLSKPKFPDDMVPVPAGEFFMGCVSRDAECRDNEKPGKTVYLDAFYIDKYEVTQGQFATCVRAGVCSSQGMKETTYEPKNNSSYCNWRYDDRGRHPVNCVNWTQADAYCRWKGRQLPTEAQWEKAARGTERWVRTWGNGAISCSKAVYDNGTDGCGENHTSPVGSKPQGLSPYGAYDMNGNVWEWTSDWYVEKYFDQAASRNPTGPKTGSSRVYRGGGYIDSGKNVRNSARFRYGPDFRFQSVGFRCAMPAK